MGLGSRHMGLGSWRDQIAHKKAREVGVIRKHLHQLLSIDLTADPHTLGKGAAAKMATIAHERLTDERVSPARPEHAHEEIVALVAREALINPPTARKASRRTTAADGKMYISPASIL